MEFSETRYPYTYAWDLVRGWASDDAPVDEYGLKPRVLSRAGASYMCGKIADAVGVDKVEMAKALANQYMIKKDITKPF